MRNDAHYPLLLENWSTISKAAIGGMLADSSRQLAARCPLPLLGHHPGMGQAQLLVETEHDVHVLHGLA
jgi:hypothetical protein